MEAYGFIEIYEAEAVREGGVSEFVRLTKFGRQRLTEEMAIRAD